MWMRVYNSITSTIYKLLFTYRPYSRSDGCVYWRIRIQFHETFKSMRVISIVLFMYTTNCKSSLYIVEVTDGLVVKAGVSVT